LTTQLFVKGDPGNEKDGIYNAMGDRKDAVTAEFSPVKDSKIGELAASFEIIVGHTPEEPAQNQGRPQRRG